MANIIEIKRPDLALVKELKDPASLTEQAVMRRFVMWHQDKLRYNHDSRQWLIWSDHYWKPDTTGQALAWALELCRAHDLKAKPAAHKIKFAFDIEKAARTQPEVATDSSSWDRDPHLLGTPGGVVELKTGKLRPGRPEDMISKVTACAPAETADCPQFLEFTNFALGGNAENIAFFQKFWGYGITGLTKEEFLLYLLGPGGAGKGTAMKTFQNILRDYAASAPIEMFTDTRAWQSSQYYRAGLAGFRVIFASEPEKGAAWSEAFVNLITGSDPISGRHPAGRPFTFNPTHKLCINGNSVPELKSTASGLKRRLGILPFEHKPEVPNTSLKEELHAEYPGILRWAIDGCLMWQCDGLRPPAAVKAAAGDYFSSQDVFGRWVEECGDLIPTAQVKPNDLRAAYNEWAEENGERTMNGNEFYDAIKNCGIDGVSQGKSNGVRWVRGIVVKHQTNKANGAQAPKVHRAAGNKAVCEHCWQGYDAGPVLIVSMGGCPETPLHEKCARDYFDRRFNN